MFLEDEGIGGATAAGAEMGADGVEGGLVASMPGFAEGGRVENTGIALVHEGEYIVPAPGSEARITGGGDWGAGQVINYYFPVEIEVVGALSREQMESVAQFVFDELADAMDARV